MPIYTFQSDDGQTQDLPFSMAEVPRIGERVEIDGVLFRRIFCGRVGEGTIAMRGKYPYLSHSLSPCRVHGAKNIHVKGGKAKVLIESAKHEREVMARNDLVREG